LVGGGALPVPCRGAGARVMVVAVTRPTGVWHRRPWSSHEARARARAVSELPEIAQPLAVPFAAVNVIAPVPTTARQKREGAAQRARAVVMVSADWANSTVAAIRNVGSLRERDRGRAINRGWPPSRPAVGTS